MAIELYRDDALLGIRKACQVATATLRKAADCVRAGMTTGAIDSWVHSDTLERGATPSQLGYHGFPRSVCVSRNDVVCHGIPRDDEFICEGDVLNIDVTSKLGGYHGDTSLMVAVGEISAEARHLLWVTEACLRRGIEAVRPGAHLGDIGAEISELAKREGCSVVREYGGHGIGREMHMEPHVSHHGKRGRGLRLVEGMVFTIEPMINLGSPQVLLDADGWTVRTLDGSLSAQMEHTVLVTGQGVEILTLPSETRLS
jgi:methionyl aminopeptidase